MTTTQSQEATGGIWTARRLAFPLLVGLVVLALYAGYAPGLADPDWWWHLETGRLILEARALPVTDPFSWTRAGADWAPRSWLFDAGLAALWQAAGGAWVTVAVAVLLALGWWIAVATADRMVRRTLSVLVLALMLGAGMPAAGVPGPQVISLLLFAILLAAVFRARYAARHWRLALVPLAMALWVNLGSDFRLGVAAMVGFAVLEWLVLALGQRDARQLRLCFWFTVTAAATVAATGATPWGYAHWAAVVPAGLPALADAVGSWTSIMADPLVGAWYALGGVLFFVVLANAPNRPDLTEVLFPAGLFLAGLLDASCAPFAGMAMLVFAAPALWRDRPAPLPPTGLFRPLGWLVASVGLVTPVLLVVGGYPPGVERATPSDVAAWVAETRPPGRMLNDREIGGYLIHRLPDRPVFIDTRPGLYEPAFVRAHAETLAGEVPLAAHFDQWAIGHAILRPRDALVRALIARGWQVAFRGRSHVVLVPPGT